MSSPTPSLAPCQHKSIPCRLHTGNRVAAPISEDDEVYLRHPPLADGQEDYGFEIPGYHLLDQSVHSRDLNLPDGLIVDVLHNGKTGEYHDSYGIAALDVRRLHQYELPNPNTVIHKDSKGNPINSLDVFSFCVLHEPTECLYPHAIVELRKNGVAGASIPKHIKTSLRSALAKMAQEKRAALLRRIDEEKMMPVRAVIDQCGACIPHAVNVLTAREAPTDTLEDSNRTLRELHANTKSQATPEPSFLVKLGRMVKSFFKR